MIATSDYRINIVDLCKTANVSRSGYYHHLSMKKKVLVKQSAKISLMNKIVEVMQSEDYKGQGARFIKMKLECMYPDEVVSRKKISQIMEEFNLVCLMRRPNPKRKFIKDLLNGTIAENLVKRDFSAYGPRIVLLTDVTYLPYGNGKCAYLSAILDAFTDEILAHVVSPNMEEEFVLETVRQLRRNHKIELNAYTIVHSDQGGQYTSPRFKDILKDSNLRQSMSKKACCYDNAPIESFWGHMKDEIGRLISKCTTFEQVKKIVDDYIHYHNNDRPQWSHAHLAPSEYYQFYVTGKYPRETLRVPKVPKATKDPASIQEKKPARSAEADQNNGSTQPSEGDTDTNSTQTETAENLAVATIK